MSAMYGESPAGWIQNIPPAIPTCMLYRVKQIQGISKQTIKLVPLSGQISVSQQGKIIVSLPPNSLVDLSTFELNFTGTTQHRGMVQLLMLLIMSKKHIFHEIPLY